jgi:hypothetical protein
MIVFWCEWSIQWRKSMPRDRRQKRDLHALNDDGMVLCNPRDKDAAHRAEMEWIATADDAGRDLPEVPVVDV